MITLDGNTLIKAGFAPGPRFKQILARAHALVALLPANTLEDLLELLHSEFPPEPPKPGMNRVTAPLSEAIRAETPEEENNLIGVRRQMSQLLGMPLIEKGAIMPDSCPAGSAPAVIPVGGAIAVRNAIIPSAHSADICCSMFATFYKSETPVAEELDALLSVTRFGAGGRAHGDTVWHPVVSKDVWHNRFLAGLQNYAIYHMADQGDGNHFAYIGEVTITPETLTALEKAGYDTLSGQFSAGKTYRVLVTHHGSRGLGAQLYKRGQAAAVKHTEKVASGIPAAAAWLDYGTDEGKEYWAALQYISEWTRANHESIHERFLKASGKKPVADIGNEHNFVWKRGDLFYHGKGATPAWEDESGRPKLGLIPLNMAEPILLVLGSNNEEYLSFAPHGAGRNLSRTALKEKIAVSIHAENPDPETRFSDAEMEEKTTELMLRKTSGIDVRWYSGKADISETPLAYKDAATVKNQIQEFGLAEVIAEIQPLGCIMAGEGEEPAWKFRQAAEKMAKALRDSGKTITLTEHRPGYTYPDPGHIHPDGTIVIDSLSGLGLKSPTGDQT